MARAIVSWRAWLRASLVLGAGFLQVAGSSHETGTHLQLRPGSGCVYEISRTAGEAQLNDLARSAKTEDAWLFARGTWIDVGFDERAKSVLLDQGTAMEALGEAARAPAAATATATAASAPVMVPASAPVMVPAPAPVTFYHIHLYTADSTFVDPPSVQDIHGLAVLKEEDANVLGVVLDGRGRWTFDLSPLLERRILDDLRLRSGNDEPGDYAFNHGYVPVPGSSGALFDLQYTLAVWSASAAGSASRAQRIGTFIDGVRRLGVFAAYSAFSDVETLP